MRLTLILLACLACTAAAADDPPASLPVDPALGDYLAWAAAHHPAVAGARQQAEAMHADADRAGSLPELRLAWGEMIVPVETRVGPQQRVLSISQSLPWFGTLGLRGQAAGAGARAADAGVTARRVAVQRDVRAAWYRLGALERELAFARSSADLAEAAVTWLRAAYEGGRAPYARLLQAEMDASKQALVVTDLEDRRLPAAAALNAAAGLPVGTPAPRADLPDSSWLGGGLPSAERLASELFAANPELASLAARRDGARLGAEAAGRAARPSLTFGVDYIMTGEARMPGTEDSGKDPVIARVSVGLPLWGGAGAERRAAAGRMRAADEDLSDRRLQLEGRLAQARYAWREAGRRLDLQRRVMVPRARQLVTVAEAAYAADAAAYGDVLAARRALLGMRTDQVRAELDLALALNDLAALVGIPPEDLAGAAAADPEERP